MFLGFRKGLRKAVFVGLLASLHGPAAFALTLGDTYNMTPDQRTLYLIGLYEAWATRPDSPNCPGDPMVYVDAAAQFVRSLSADPSDTRRKLYSVPAAAIIQTVFGSECARLSGK